MSATRYYVTEVSEVPDDGDKVIVDIEGREIAIFNVKGEYHALLNFCVHQGAPLCEGQTTGESTVAEDGTWIYDRSKRLISCPWHAWRFDIETGENVQDDRYAVPTYGVEVEDDQLYVKF